MSLTVDSELELPEFLAVTRPGQGHAIPDVIVRLGTVDPDQSTTADDEIVCRDMARFRIRGGCEIIVDAVPGADPGALRAALLGKVMAYLMRQRGYLPLHASGVAIAGGAVLFLGHSGAGKSTTAAAFQTRGHEVVTDDLGAVRVAAGGVELLPTCSSLRLLDDARCVIRAQACPIGHIDNKHVFGLERQSVGLPLPVTRIYFLEYEDRDGQCAVRREAVSGFVAVALLNSNSYLGTWEAGSAPLQLNLERASSVAAAATIGRLFRPRSLDSLDRVVDFVEKDVADAGKHRG